MNKNIRKKQIQGTKNRPEIKATDDRTGQAIVRTRPETKSKGGPKCWEHLGPPVEFVPGPWCKYYEWKWCLFWSWMLCKASRNPFKGNKKNDTTIKQLTGGRRERGRCKRWDVEGSCDRTAEREKQPSWWLLFLLLLSQSSQIVRSEVRHKNGKSDTQKIQTAEKHDYNGNRTDQQVEIRLDRK